MSLDDRPPRVTRRTAYSWMRHSRLVISHAKAIQMSEKWCLQEFTLATSVTSPAPRPVGSIKLIWWSPAPDCRITQRISSRAKDIVGTACVSAGAVRPDDDSGHMFGIQQQE